MTGCRGGGLQGAETMDAERPPRTAYRFDHFTLDLDRGALLAPDGAELPLRPKSFALLQFLVENAGRLLDRDAIMQAVWPDVVVTDDSITQCVGEIRRALGERCTAPSKDHAATGLPLRGRGGARHQGCGRDRWNTTTG